MDDDPRDDPRDDPLSRANMDQAKANMTPIADLTKSAFDAFVKQGFTERQALSLTKAWMRSTMLLGDEDDEL